MMNGDCESTGKKIMTTLTLTLIALSIVSVNAYGSRIPEESTLSIQQMKYDPHPVQTGSYFDLWVMIENIGDEDAENITCELEEQYPFSLDPDEDSSRSIDTLPAQQEKMYRYQVRTAEDAVEGTNKMKFKCRNPSVGKGWITKELKIKVEGGPRLGIGKVSSDPLKLKPGSEEVKLEVEVQNIGQSNASFVTTDLELPDGFEYTYSYSGKDELGKLNSGEDKKAVFYIDVDDDTNPGSHNGSLKVKYGEDGEKEEKEFNIPLDVKEMPEFQIKSVKTTPKELSQGDKAKARVKVKQTGSKESESTSAKIYAKSDQPIEFQEDYDYIGNLEPGETGEAIFEFTVDGDAELKKQKLDLEIRYVTDNEVKVDQETVSINIQGKKSVPILYYGLAGALIIVTLAVAAKYLHSKRNKK